MIHNFYDFSSLTPAQVPSKFRSINASCWFHLCDPSSSFLVGPQGPTGPNPSAGLNAAIPYEPYNLNIGSTATTVGQMPSTAVIYTQFIAPSTANYYKMTIFYFISNHTYFTPQNIVLIRKVKY